MSCILPDPAIALVREPRIVIAIALLVETENACPVKKKKQLRPACPATSEDYVKLVVQLAD